MAVSPAIVTQYYTNVIRVAPTAAQVTYYSNAADAATLLTTLENQATVQVNPIIRLYQGAFNRVPDPVGLNGWVAQYVNGPTGTGTATLNAIATGFVGAPEFAAIYGNNPIATVQSQTAMVSNLYTNVLNRPAGQVEVNLWLTEIARQQSLGYTNTQIATNVLLGFTNSPEFIQSSATSIQAFQSASAQNTETYTGSLWAQAAGTTYTLTTGVDTITVNNNGVVNGILGTGATWTPFDSITGNGSAATFNLIDLTAGAFGAGSVPGGSTTSGLTTVNLNRAAAAGDTSIGVTITNTTFGTGVQNLSVLESGAATNATAAAGASVTLNSAKTVSVVSTGVGKFNGVTITDTAQAAATRGSTLTTVTVQGVATTGVTLDGNAITTVNLNDVATLTTVNAAAGTRALTVNASGTASLGGLTDAQATSATLNISGTLNAGFGTLTVAKATTVTINTTAATNATLSAAVATTLNLGGTKSLALTVNTTPAVTSILVTGAGGVSANVSAITTLATVDTTGSTAVAATATNGLTGTIANAFTLNTTTTFTGGAGDDNIIVGATTKALTLGGGTNQAEVTVTALGTGGSINGGTGTADVLKLSNANAAAITATAATAAAFKAAVTGFEVLDAGTADGTTISLSSFGTFNKLKLVTANVTQILSGVASGTTFELTAGAAGLASLTTNTLGGASDVINVRLTDNLSAGVKAYGKLTLPGVETVNITTVDSNTTFAATLATLEVVDTNATTINISGNNGLALTHAGTALQTFNASGVTTGEVTFTSDALTNNVVVTGSATGSDVLNFSSATGTVTITAGNGGGTFTGATAAVVNTITGGNGTDIIIGGAGADVLSGGAGTDTITGLAGKDVITGGAGIDTIRYTTALTSVGAAGVNVDTVVGFVAGTDKIQLKTLGGANNLLDGVTLGADAAMATMGAVVTSATNVDTLTQVYTALGTSLAAMAKSAANGKATVAQVVTFTSGAAAGTYLVVNDAADGFDGAKDIVINITGVSGTVSAGDFSFAA